MISRAVLIKNCFNLLISKSNRLIFVFYQIDHKNCRTTNCWYLLPTTSKSKNWRRWRCSTQTAQSKVTKCRRL